MSVATKFYVAQWGFEIFGEGLSEIDALKSARQNALQFDDSDVKHPAHNNHGKLVTKEGDELSNGMIVVMTESEKSQYWDN